MQMVSTLYHQLSFYFVLQDHAAAAGQLQEVEKA